MLFLFHETEESALSRGGGNNLFFLGILCWLRSSLRLSHAFRLDRFRGTRINWVTKLRSGARDWGSDLGLLVDSFLLSLVVRGAGDLLEEAAENGAALGLGLRTLWWLFRLGLNWGSWKTC